MQVGLTKRMTSEVGFLDALDWVPHRASYVRTRQRGSRHVVPSPIVDPDCWNDPAAQPATWNCTVEIPARRMKRRSLLRKDKEVHTNSVEGITRAAAHTRPEETGDLGQHC